MYNWIYLVLAYSAVWLGVLLYVFINTNKLSEIEQKIEDLESMLAQKH
jgi:CcmD family protein